MGLRFFPIFLCIAVFLPVYGYSQEAHLNEPGSGPILSRSAFAHGYRHGYEEGYHRGNMDINMGRTPREKKALGHEMNLGYSSGFGSKQSFAEGFHAGFQAGYSDGYTGLEFRAVKAVRALATDLPTTASSGDFDQGLGAGYHDGFVEIESSLEPTSRAASTLDFEAVSCNPRFHDPAAGFCDGYRRGFALGHADALNLDREYVLEASK